MQHTALLYGLFFGHAKDSEEDYYIKLGSYTGAVMEDGQKPTTEGPVDMWEVDIHEVEILEDGTERDVVETWYLKPIKDPTDPTRQGYVVPYLNERDFAQAMIDYSCMKKALDELEKKLEGNTVSRGKSYKVAGVTCTYYKPSAKVDYARAVAEAEVPEEIITKHTKTSTTVSWKGVADEADLDLTRYTTPVPERATIKTEA